MRGSRWAQKPPVGTAIDWSDPLGEGLLALHALGEGTGIVAGDSAGRLPLAATGYGAASPWGAGPSGGGVLGGSAAGFVATVPASMQLSWPMTIAIAGRLLGAPSGSQRLMALTPSAANSSPFLVMELYAASATSIGVAYQAGGAVQTLTPLAVAQGTDFVASMSVTPDHWSEYLDGLAINSGAHANAAPTWTPTAQLALAGWPAVGGASACSPLYWAAWWGRALSADEHARIGRDVNAIYRVFRPRYPAARAFVAPPGGRPSYPRGRSVLVPTSLTNSDYISTRYGE